MSGLFQYSGKKKDTMKKFLVFRHRDGKEASFDFDRPGHIANFLQGTNPEHYTVFVQVTGLDFKNVCNMRGQLTGISLEAALDQI